MTDDALPEPPVPADADLRHFPTMPLDVRRLRDSDLAGVEDGDVFRAAVLSWCAAWHQLPAGSLPDDDAALARLLGFGRDVRGWRRVRAKGGLRGWIRCSDGRLYHPVVAAAAHDALHKSRVAARANAARWSARKGQDAEKEGNPSSERNASGVPRREGKGREGIESSPSPPKEGGEGVASAGAAAPPAPDGNQGKPPKTAPPEIPLALLNDMAAAWNAMARIHGLPQVSEVTPKRAIAMRARINERWRKDPMGMWTRYLEAIAASPFLRGENPRGWRANLDWAIRPDSPVRVQEGRYSDDEGDG
jgi:hypothetical protein